MNKKFVIEHLEKSMWPWCKVEYENSAKLISPYKLIVTNVKKGNYSFGKNSKIERRKFSEFDIDWKRVCVLDPKARKVLKTEDKEKFDYFVFGGILGDEKFNGRTGDELTMKLPSEVSLRHIGSKQFSTDNALFVTRMILDGKKLKDIKFENNVEVKINEIESVMLPYCYPLINGKPQISDKLITYLKRKKSF